METITTTVVMGATTDTTMAAVYRLSVTCAEDVMSGSVLDGVPSVEGLVFDSEMVGVGGDAFWLNLFVETCSGDDTSGSVLDDILLGEVVVFDMDGGGGDAVGFDVFFKACP